MCLHERPEDDSKHIMRYERLWFGSARSTMGRKRWPTIEEFQWLQSNIPRFRDSQRQHKLPDFYQETAQAFFMKFPGALPAINLATGKKVDRYEGNIALAPDWKAGRVVRFLSFDLLLIKNLIRE